MTDNPTGLTVRLALPYEKAVERTRGALKDAGFGILTEIDMRAAFAEKLGREFRPYVILGACNPPLAYAALSADPEVGLLLPCNVTVEAESDAVSIVRLVDPIEMLRASGPSANDAVARVATDARARLLRAKEALES